MTLLRAASLIAFAAVLGYTIFAIWRRRSGSEPADEPSGFRPRIGFTRLDGMASVSLLLTNQSASRIWAEEVEIYLSDLVANDQTAEPAYHEVQKIRQMVARRDTLPISLAGVIYKAAGEPQRRYSCVMTSVLRFRVGDQWIEKQLQTYRIKMAGLVALGIRRERKPVTRVPVRAEEKSADISAAAAQSK